MKVGCFSIGLGIAVGAAVSVIMKNTPNLTKNPMNETMFIIIGAYLAYSLAHLGFFQLSGDVAIFFYGVIVSHYTKYNMSETSFRNIGLSFNLIMQLAEAICFIYIGLGVGDAVIGHQENIYYALFILGVLFVSRSLVIGVTAILLKSAKLLIEPREYFPIIMSGMIKGPMAYIFANVLVPFRSPCLDIKNHHQYIQSYPLFVMQICVIISLVVLTPLNYLVFRLFVNKDSIDLTLRASSKDDERTEFKKKILDGIWEINQKKPRVFEYVDEYFFKPSLIRDYHERRDEIEKMKVHFDVLSGAYDHGVHLEHSILHGDGHHGHGDDHHGHGEDHHDHGSKEHGHGDDHHKNEHESSHKIEAHDSKHHDSKNHQKPHHDPHSPEATAHNHKHSSPPHESSVSITPKNTENLPDIGLDLPAPAKTASTPPPPTVTETQTPVVPVTTTTTTAAATEQAAVPDRPEEPSVPVTDASVNTTVTVEAPKDAPPEN